mgnify:CR=1 FL=1
MKKILEIESSKYSIEYEEGKEWIYSVKRYGVDTGSDLKTNIVFDMFQMILNLQAKNEKLKMTQENSSSRAMGKCYVLFQMRRLRLIRFRMELQRSLKERFPNWKILNLLTFQIAFNLSLRMRLKTQAYPVSFCQPI